MYKAVYVTGCLGFIGFHLTKKCLDKGWYVYGIDSQTYASNTNFLQDLLNYPKFKYLKKDINDLTRLADCDYFINTAAETHVDNSIVCSESFLKSNVNGVHKILQLIKQKKQKPILLHFSTDEVYGDIDVGSFSEKQLLKPSNPYSATKAAADMLILAWARTFNIPYVIVRPTNNYGIGQYVEKLIPKAIKYLSLGRKIILHDKGLPRRTWLHVSDTVSAVMKIIETGKTNEIYNISGNHEEQNINVARQILFNFGIYNNEEDWIDGNEKRLGQDVRYSVDDSKLKKLGWEPKADFNKELQIIVEYYKKNFVW
jgi:dTDP-glucose 4,6-dehydratase